MCYPLIESGIGTIGNVNGNDMFSSMMANALGAIGNILLLLERKRIRMNRHNKNNACASAGGKWKSGRRILHRIMLRWLDRGDDSAKGGVCGSMHPLASQIVMALVQTHIVRSFLMDRYECETGAATTRSTNENISSNETKINNGKKESTNRTKGKVSLSFNSDGLVRSMSRIMFDRRTGTILRRNIGVVLYRILVMCNNALNAMLILIPLKKRVEAVLISSYQDFLFHNMKDA